MPFQPLTITAGQNPLVQFDGLITTYFLDTPPGTAFQIKQIYKPLPKDLKTRSEAANAYRGPPRHFHPNQTERFKVVKGRVGIEVNGKTSVLGPEGGVAVCLAGNIHRFYVDVSQDDNGDVSGEKTISNGQKRRGKEDDDVDNEETIILINITDSGKDLAMDRVLLENWYGLRHDSLKYGKGIDYIQQCCTFDAGAHYLPFPDTLPNFVPENWSLGIRTFLGYWITILVGRWIGGLLGYQPFFREYTTDWEYAHAKMRHTWFYKKNLEVAYRQRTPWAELEKLDAWSNERASRMDTVNDFEQFTNGIRAEKNGTNEEAIET